MFIVIPTVALANIYTNDARKEITPDLQKQFPFSIYGRLYGANRTCTAALVGPDLIASAAHCVLRSEGRGIIRARFDFHLQYGRKRGYADTAKVIDIKTGNQSMEHGSTSEMTRDRALMRIDKPLGNKYGFIPIEPTNYFDPTSTFHMIGYHSDRYNATQMFRESGCRFRGMDGAYLNHDCSGAPASSGSPMIMIDKNNHIAIVALHNGGRASGPVEDLEPRPYGRSNTNGAVSANIFIGEYKRMLAESQARWKK